jgi:F-box/leucine-rich repeat protein 2/20
VACTIKNRHIARKKKIVSSKCGPPKAAVRTWVPNKQGVKIELRALPAQSQTTGHSLWIGNPYCFIIETFAMQRKSARSDAVINILGDEILVTILDKLQDPIDRKSWCLVCKHFFYLEANYRKKVQLMRSELLPRILRRYSKIQYLDLSLCCQITDESLGHVADILGNHLVSINLSKLWTFSHLGLLELVKGCQSLVEIDLSNCTEITDYAAEAIAKARKLQSLKLVKCKQITDMGLGCIAVGCNKLQTLNLRWCVGVTDLGVELVAVKCKELRNLDLSYSQITNKCLASIKHLNHLENLALVGCVGVGDNGLTYLKKSLQIFFLQLMNLKSIY